MELHVRLGEEMIAVFVRSILSEKGASVEVVDPDLDVRRALRIMIEKEIGSLVVMKEDKVLGIVSERDILRECDRHGEVPKGQAVREIMTENLIIGVPDDTLEYVMAIMTQNRIRHLPIMEGGKLVGLVSIGDAVKHRLDEQEAMNRYLIDYISGKYPA